MIGIEKTNIFQPETIVTAEQIAKQTGIPERIIIEKFGLKQKRIASSSMHVSDLAIEAGKRIVEKVDPSTIDALIYFGSPFKDYQVWTASSKIAYELGTTNAFSFEMMNVSACFPMAVKVAKDMLYSDESLQQILLLGGSKESMIVNYENPRSRFMFNFADGGAAALIKKNATKNKVLASSFITDGSFTHDVLVPGGGSVHPVDMDVVEKKLHYIDVPDPQCMKERLDPVTVSNFIKVIKTALKKSGKTVEDVKMLFPLHTKRSLFKELLSELRLTEDQAIYLDEYGHMSALDPCVGLYLAEKRALLKKHDVVVIVSAGTGYTWAATVIEWCKS